MWEKISDYCLDVSKYFLTAVFVTSMMQDLNDVRWMLYVISGLIAIILFIAGIYIRKIKKITIKRKIMENLSLMAFNCLLDIPFLGTYIILAMVGIPAIVFLLFVMTPKGKQWFNSIN